MLLFQSSLQTERLKNVTFQGADKFCEKQLYNLWEAII